MCHLVWTCSSRGFLRIIYAVNKHFWNALIFPYFPSVLLLEWICGRLVIHKRLGITWEVMNCFVFSKSNMIYIVQAILLHTLNATTCCYLMRWQYSQYSHLIRPFKITLISVCDVVSIIQTYFKMLKLNWKLLTALFSMLITETGALGALMSTISG